MKDKNFDDFAEFSDLLEGGNAEFIQVFSPIEDEVKINESLPEKLAILPLRNNVLYPGVAMPITVGREKSVRLINDVSIKKIQIGIVAQRDKDLEDPSLEEDLYSIGTVATVLKTIKMPDGNSMVVIQGRRRFRIDSFEQVEPYIIANISPLAAPEAKASKKFKEKMDECRLLAEEYLSLIPHIQSDTVMALKNIKSDAFLLDFIASIINSNTADKQAVLEYDKLDKKAAYLAELIKNEISLLEVNKQIQSKVQVDLSKQQREFLLNQQLKKIQEELGDEPGSQDYKELQEKSKTKKWKAEVGEVFEKELNKLKRLHQMSPDYSTQLNYLNNFLDLPWGEYSADNFDLKHAQEVLDRDHFGLEKVKERIIEHLAVLKLKGDMKSPIICLVGPPGVGKTSLGKSVAEALNRKYVRISLGGLRDESEIRGHRRTYIGAMPGRIIQNLKKAKTSNPVFVLDEIDKVLGMNVNGDPSAALLEVLDPEQNTSFHDNYLDVDYDLSKVLFIATANSLSPIYPALLDRMEVIDVSGYIVEEKLEIAKRHLLPKQIEEHGLKAKSMQFSDAVLQEIIESYTRESGVRQLEKKIAKVIRSKARWIAEGKKVPKIITSQDLSEILGVPNFDHSQSLKSPQIGVVTGLAWTSVGGEILFIEASLSPGKGNLTMTGSLGDVMKESATLAYEYLKAHAVELDIDGSLFEKWNVHIHVPEGATPKDGPSAGIALFTALTSVYTKKKVRSNYAMTGEITLRGKVLPVGGIKEKILAAKRAKIEHIILCKENEKHITEIPAHYLKGLSFHYVDNMMEVLKLALI